MLSLIIKSFNLATINICQFCFSYSLEILLQKWCLQTSKKLRKAYLA